jgi:hypothetical protein
MSNRHRSGLLTVLAASVGLSAALFGSGCAAESGDGDEETVAEQREDGGETGDADGGDATARAAKRVKALHFNGCSCPLCR